MNRAFIRGLLCEFEKHAKKAKSQPAQQPQMMMPAIPPEVLAALMGAPEPEYEEPSMLQMLTPSLGLGAAGLGVGAMGGLAYPKVAPHLSNIRTNLAAKMAPMMSRMNPMRLLGKGASEKTAMAFMKQDRPRKVKEIYSALKRDHPGMPAGMKARIAARQGKPGKQKQGPPYKGPLTPQGKPSAFRRVAERIGRKKPLHERMTPLAKTAKKKREEAREDPSGTIGLLLKAMRRSGRSADPRMIMAFDRLAHNIPTNKRPY
jgi:hypothetical protein